MKLMPGLREIAQGLSGSICALLLFGGQSQADTIYVTSSDSSTIVRFDTEGHATLFATTPLNIPFGLTADSLGNLYAANVGDNTISRFNPQGTGSIYVNSGLNFPLGLAFDAQGNLYAASPLDHTIMKFDTRGNSSVFATTPGNASGLAFDRSGNLYASILTANQIMKFDPQGNGSFFANTGLWPGALAFGKDGDLYVANNGHSNASNGSVEKFDMAGTEILVASALNEPSGLAFDSSGNLYVSLYADNTILRIGPDGNSSVFANSGLSAPGYLVVVPEPSTLSLLGALVSIAAPAQFKRKTRRQPFDSARPH